MGKAHQPGTFKSVIFKQKLSIMFDICSANVAHVFNTPALTVANVLNEMGGGGLSCYIFKKLEIENEVGLWYKKINKLV